VIRRLCLLIGLVLLPTFASAAPLNIIMTTSMEASGIGPYLRAAYNKDTGQELRAIVTGSGQAYAAVRHGTIDLILTHEPAGARQLYDGGYISRPRPFMYNHFILVGPPSDPAGLMGAGTLEEAFIQLRAHKAKFISRGDNSGTHRKELTLWELTGGIPTYKDYIRAGVGMAAALRMADQLRAYTLTEPGSFLTAARELELMAVVDGDVNVENRYEVSITKDADERATGFVDWLLSPLGQGHIAAFKIGDRQPYHPIREPLTDKIGQGEGVSPPSQ